MASTRASTLTAAFLALGLFIYAKRPKAAGSDESEHVAAMPASECFFCLQEFITCVFVSPRCLWFVLGGYIYIQIDMYNYIMYVYIYM